MYCFRHFRLLLLTAAMLLPGAAPVLAQNPSQNNAQASGTAVHLRWSPRPGVLRYRLQLASDSAFADILFDRVVTGNDYQINGLLPGRYSWRIAPLTATLGEFSTPAVIEVREPTPRASPTPGAAASPPGDSSRTRVAHPILTRGGWRAAVGDIAHPIQAHLRSPATFDLVGINSDGIVFALDPSSGVALWSTGRRAPGQIRTPFGSFAVLSARSRSGLENVIVLRGASVTSLQGANGRLLWQITLPGAATNGTVISDGRSTELLLLDNSSARITILDANTGNLLTQIKLPHRAVGGPVALVRPGAGRFALAYDNGQIEIRDVTGAVVRSGDAGNPATTPPLFIRGRRGDFVLVGTRRGLTALTADELRPLGMVAIKDDAPRGNLASEDLDGDGMPEVIMLTGRGQVVAVNAADGTTIWEASVGNEVQTIAFADVDGDRVLDVVLDGGQNFALALSGRDGSVVWKDNELPALVANHSASLAPRSIAAMPYGAGLLLIAEDLSRTSLRALEFPQGTAARGH